MSHPNPHHDRENEYPHDEHSSGDSFSPKHKALSKKIAGKKTKPTTIKTLKEMIKAPASKEWFKKYGK